MTTLSVREKDGVLVVDSRLIAPSLGVTHKSFLETVKKYKKQTEQAFGQLRFETETVTNSVGAVNRSKFVYLSENQATFLMTLSRNTERVVQCKLELVKAFDEAKRVIKQVIPAQAEELERLRLENQNLHLQLEVAKAQKETAYAQERLLSASQILAMVNPALPALVLGKSDAVLTKTEVIEKTVLVNERGIAKVTFEGLSKTKLAKRYGLNNSRELVNWLKSIGQEELLKPGLVATPCQFIPWAEIKKLDDLWASRRGTRQFLIGE